MNLFLIGGYHQDPLHRIQLLEGLKFLKREHGFPAFIAVEANRVIFKAVTLHQRMTFLTLAKNDFEFSNLPHSTLEALSKAMNYEADTHEDVFEDATKILWLDDLREDFSDGMDPCGAAKRFLDLSRCAFQKYRGSDREEEIIRAINSYNTEMAKSMPLESNRSLMEKLYYGEIRSDPYERDKIWSESISTAIRTYHGDYAIIIVAVPHILEKEEYLGALLNKKKYNCHFRLLAQIKDYSPTICW